MDRKHVARKEQRHASEADGEVGAYQEMSRACLAHHATVEEKVGGFGCDADDVSDPGPDDKYTFVCLPLSGTKSNPSARLDENQVQHSSGCRVCRCESLAAYEPA